MIKMVKGVWLVVFVLIYPLYAEIITTSLVIGGLSLFGYKFKDFIADNTYCRYAECCNDDYIPNEISYLNGDLSSYLFGQHIVISQLIPALKAHLANHNVPKKPLVISFHGTPGTGKNYVSDFIAKNLYKNGLKSKFVHKFMGRSDFPLEAHSSIYRRIIYDKVKEAVKVCPRSLFIFDEVEKMPSGIFDALTSLLDHHTHLDGVDFRPSIFIFLSNTGGVEIADRLGELLKGGTWRADTSLHDFEKILEVAAYNLDGGLQRAAMIERSLVDHFIPFLPLEKEHVSKCIKTEFNRFGVYKNLDEKISKIIETAVTFDKNTGLFATAGCKRIGKKVEVEVYRS